MIIYSLVIIVLKISNLLNVHIFLRNENIHDGYFQREFEQTAEDQKKEIASLTQRLLMGQESYREKYVDCEKLEGELYKLRMGKYWCAPRGYIFLRI